MTGSRRFDSRNGSMGDLNAYQKRPIFRPLLVVGYCCVRGSFRWPVESVSLDIDGNTIAAGRPELWQTSDQRPQWHTSSDGGCRRWPAGKLETERGNATNRRTNTAQQLFSSCTPGCRWRWPFGEPKQSMWKIASRRQNDPLDYAFESPTFFRYLFLSRGWLLFNSHGKGISAPSPTCTSPRNPESGNK